MADWLVTDIDDAVWERFAAFAERQGKSAEEVLRQLIVDYATNWNARSPQQTPIDQRKEAKNQRTRPTR